MNSRKLKAYIMLNGYTQKDIANIIGITAQTLNSKINNKSNFNIREVEKICETLKIEDPREIFFVK